MKVIQIVSELSPFTGKSRIGVLLEQFIMNLNHRHAFTIMPWYEDLKFQNNNQVHHMHFKNHTVFKTLLPGSDSEVFLIKPLKGYFPNFSEDDQHCLFQFSYTVVEFLQTFDEPFILHLHGIACGLIPLLLKSIPSTKHIKTLFTLHRINNDIPIYEESFAKYGLSEFHKNEIMTYGADSSLKIGLLFADLINTTSKQYANEIQSEEFGNGLERFFQKRVNEIYGIMNGVRYGIWNPALDSYLPCKYSLENLQGKFYNKVILQEKTGLEDREEFPIFFFGTRLSEEKGLDLIVSILPILAKMPLQLLIYGLGEDELIVTLENEIHKYNNIRFIQEYDEDFVHLILAGSDFILLPSKIEPDGISFLYALRYGLIPVAYKTGGFVDAVFDQSCGDSSKVNGFFFSSYDENSLISIIKETLDVHKDKLLFDVYVKNAMSADWSWKVCVKQYDILYQKLDN